jgi:hypothetical protein
MKNEQRTMNKEQRAMSKVRGVSWSRFPFALCYLLIAHLYCSLLFAQDGGTGFIQRLTCTEDEYARRYEVIIEKEEEGEYRELFQEFTTALFIEVSLLPGKYRCRVITYDFLNRPGPVPEWKYIEVLAVLNPEPVHGNDDIELDHYEQAHIEQFHIAGIPVDLFMSAAWMPSFTISDGGNSFFERDMALSGATVRFGAVWARSYLGINPGLELPISYNFFHTGSGEQAHLLTFALNILAQKWLPGNRMALTFRLGAGYGLLFTDDGDTAASFSGGKSFHLNAGVSFLLFVMERRNSFRMYVETGLDYANWFTSPASYYFRPWVGIGFCK